MLVFIVTVLFACQNVLKHLYAPLYKECYGWNILKGLTGSSYVMFLMKGFLSRGHVWKIFCLSRCECVRGSMSGDEGALYYFFVV